MNYTRGLIGAGGLGAIALALIDKVSTIPAGTLSIILGGMGVLVVVLVGIDSRLGQRTSADVGASAAQNHSGAAAEGTRSLIYLACSRKRPNLVSSAENFGPVFDSFEAVPTRSEVRDAIKEAKAVVAIIEPGPRRDCALIELGHALPDKRLYLLVARHRDQPDLSAIEPQRDNATYLIFDNDRDLDSQLKKYWGYVHAGRVVSKDAPRA